MNTAYVSGRVPPRYERLVVKQAQAANTSKSNLVARYLIEKSLETEFPGISLRGSVSCREAYLSGHSDAQLTGSAAGFRRRPCVASDDS